MYLIAGKKISIAGHLAGVDLEKNLGRGNNLQRFSLIFGGEVGMRCI